MMVADAAKGASTLGERGAGDAPRRQRRFRLPAAEAPQPAPALGSSASRGSGDGPAAASATTSSSASTTCRRRRRGPRRCASSPSTRSSTSSTPPTTRASAPSCARRTTGSAPICDHVRADPERYRDFAFYPCMPYAHKYANAVTESGMLGAVKRFLPDEGLLDADVRGGDLGGEARTSRAHHAADRRRDEDVRRPPHAGHLPPEHRRRPAARPRLQGRVPDLRRPRRATATTPSRASSR